MSLILWVQVDELELPVHGMDKPGCRERAAKLYGDDWAELYFVTLKEFASEGRL
jgi:hypothetical protein